MQIRESEFRREDGCRQPQCNGKLHRHGGYRRYAHPEGQERFEVPRYSCTRCGLTASVLHDSRLPYRPVTTEEVEAAFDRKSRANSAIPLPSPLSEKRRGCLNRAWMAWNPNSRRIAELLRHQLPRSATKDPAQCWRCLRDVSHLSPMLAIIWERFQTSLLGDYQCLKPRSHYRAPL